MSDPQTKDRWNALDSVLFHKLTTGDPESFVSQFFVLLNASLQPPTEGLNGNQAGAAHDQRTPFTSEDMEAVRAEITQLAQTVRGVGESTAKLERRWSMIGDSLSKIEERVKTLDEVTTTFAGVKRHQLWQLVALSGAMGAALAFGIQFLVGWLGGMLHI